MKYTVNIKGISTHGIAGLNSYQEWIRIPGNEEKTFEEYIAWIQEPANVAAAAANVQAAAAAAAASSANSARIAMLQAFDLIADSEDARASAEALRVNAESARVNAEALRVQAESGRGDTEALRVAAEEARVTAEGLRVQAESARASAEALRVQAESARVTAEGLRVTAEESRVSAEALRVNADTSRTNAESLRVTAEQNRVTVEGLRVTAEQSRASVEALRVTAEQARASAEALRVTAEQARVTAEGLRVDAEASRVAAESTRAVAIQQNTEQIKGLVNVLSTANINNESRIATTGYDTVALPKNAIGATDVKLEGRTAENRVINGDFSNGTTGWGAAIGTPFNSISIVDGYLQLGWTSGDFKIYAQTVPLVSGNKYYTKTKIKPTLGTASLIMIGISTGEAWESRVGLTNAGGFTLNVWDVRSALVTASNNKTHIGLAAYPSSSSTWLIEYVYCINLTATFGAGNEPDKATCDKIFESYFEGVKSVNATGRYRSSNNSTLYLNAGQLRSTPTAKDEIRKSSNGYEKVRRTGEGTLGAELTTNGSFDTDTAWTKNTGATISGGVLNSDGTGEAFATIASQSIVVGNNKWYVILFGMLGYVAGNVTVSLGTTGTILSSTSGNGLKKNFFKSSESGTALLRLRNGSIPCSAQFDNFSVKEVTAAEAIAATPSFFEVGANVLFNLGTPVITPLQTAGLLTAESGGTIYQEQALADAGIYSTKLDILLTGYPIASLEEIKVIAANGDETYLDISTAVIAGDGLSFTHPDLVANDLVFFTYFFDKEKVSGLTTVNTYDSRVVKLDTANGKYYRIGFTVTNGVAVLTATEI